MGALQPIHWIVLLVVVVVLFGGRGKLSGIMGDAAKGIKEFKNGLKDDDAKPAAPAASVQPLPTEVERRERDQA